MGFVTNFIRFPAVQKFWKSVKIWQSCREFKGGNFFETQCREDRSRQKWSSLQQQSNSGGSSHAAVITAIVLRASHHELFLVYLCCDRRPLRRLHFCCSIFASREHPLRNLSTEYMYICGARSMRFAIGFVIEPAVIRCIVMCWLVMQRPWTAASPLPIL